MSPRPQTSRLRYEPALDGLRAVAVLAVMLYHGQVRQARGGFLGVDLFFVLSGYLITTLLLVEQRETGRVDLREFWARRARRLLPALYVMLAAVAGYAALLAPPARLARLRWDALATIGYVANWRFSASHLSYFDQFGDPSPLLHMWSLGIEEQYYVLWPLLLVLGVRLARGRARPLLTAVLAAAAGSALLMAALYHPGSDPSRVYYGTDTRAQALLAGAALAIALYHLRLPGLLADALGAAGLGGLLLLMARVPDTAGWMYRGGFLLAALAAAGAITAAISPGARLRRVLAAPPLPAVGRISYGLYLWHWPVYVVLTPERSHLPARSLALLGLRVAATFLAALASYRLVELPIRRGALRRRGVARPATVGAVAALTSLLVLATAGAQAAPTALAAASRQAAVFGDPGTAVGVPDSVLRAIGPTAAARGARTLRAYVVGDSVAGSLAWFYHPALFPGLHVDSTATAGCGVARALNYFDNSPQKPIANCFTWPTTWREGLARYHPDVVVLFVGAWETFDKYLDGRVLHVGTPEYEAYLDGEMELAYSSLSRFPGKIAMMNVPCYHQQDTGVGSANEAADRNSTERGDWLNGVFGRFAARHRDKIVVLDLKGFLCPAGLYADTMQGVQLRFDGVHFTADGADLVWQWLLPQLRQLVPAGRQGGGSVTRAAPAAPGR